MELTSRFVQEVVSPPPEVTLAGMTRNAPDLPTSAAKTCYAPKLVEARPASEYADPEKEKAVRNRITALTYEAGHHTVYQHVTYTFALRGVSRNLIHCFLHAFPFYNTEQQSQRYVEMKVASVTVPPFAREEHRRLFESAVIDAWETYYRLIEALRPHVEAIYKQQLWAHRPAFAAWEEGKIDKMALEVARYVLPIACHADFYYTINQITLLSLNRLRRLPQVRWEADRLIGAMVEAAAKADPGFAALLENPLSDPYTTEGSLEALLAGKHGVAGAGQAESFDAQCDGLVSRLLSWPQVNHRGGLVGLLADALRLELGLPAGQGDDADLIADLLDPARNPYLSSTLNLVPYAPATQVLHHGTFTFAKRLSHTADSQNQRHRTMRGSRQLLIFGHLRRPDVVVPDLIESCPEALRVFDAAMARTWERINRLVDDGVPMEYAAYLYPNAKVVRLYETCDLAGLLHKANLRLCFRAQREIFEATRQEVRQIGDLYPEVVRYFAAPCVVRHRAGRRPVCPEKKGFCGVPVWKEPESARLL
ncbi:MAG: FAD-dependent thymidylate synthase [Acidobacteriota bacterium]